MAELFVILTMLSISLNVIIAFAAIDDGRLAWRQGIYSNTDFALRLLLAPVPIVNVVIAVVSVCIEINKLLDKKASWNNK